MSKVIHKGKVLEEGKPVSDYGDAAADMFVVLVNKTKPKAATEPTVDEAPKPGAPTVPAQAPAAASGGLPPELNLSHSPNKNSAKYASSIAYASPHCVAARRPIKSQRQACHGSQNLSPS